MAFTWLLLRGHFSEVFITYHNPGGACVIDLVLKGRNENTDKLLAFGNAVQRRATTQCTYTQRCKLQSLKLDFTSFLSYPPAEHLVQVHNLFFNQMLAFPV